MEPKPNFEHPYSQSSLPQNISAPTQDDTEFRFQEVERKIDEKIANHIHDGGGAQRINFNTDIIGLFETVSAVPTGSPKGPYDQVKVYVNGGTLRLYWYDGVANVWHYVTATA